MINGCLPLGPMAMQFSDGARVELDIFASRFDWFDSDIVTINKKNINTYARKH